MTAPSSSSADGPFSSLAVLWMVVVGVIAAVLFLVLTAYAPRLRSESDGGAHAMSKSAVGFAGLVKLLGDEGVPVLLNRDAHLGGSPRASLLVLTPSLDSAPKAMARLGGAGIELIVLPKWAASPDLAHPGWVMSDGPLPATAITDLLLHAYDGGDHIEQAPGRANVVLPGMSAAPPTSPLPPYRLAIDRLQTVVGPDRGWVAILESSPGHAVLIRRADTNLFILTDPDLLDNQGLANLATARAATDIIGALRGGNQDLRIANMPVVLDLTLAGFVRTRSLLGLAFEPPFLAATLCAMAAAGLMGLHAFARFGPPLRPAPAFALGKRALADNSAALVRLVRREHAMGSGYAALTRNLAARAVGAPRDLNDDQMDALLDRLGKVRSFEAEFSDLERRARDARDVTALMAAARALFQWRLEMTHERR